MRLPASASALALTFPACASTGRGVCGTEHGAATETKEHEHEHANKIPALRCQEFADYSFFMYEKYDGTNSRGIDLT